MNGHHLVNLAYLAASVFFVIGLKRLTNPRTAPSGNQICAVGMLLAIVAALAQSGLGRGSVVLGLIIGSGSGLAIATLRPSVGMAQRVALLCGFGGLAALLVGGGTLITASPQELRSRLFLLAISGSALFGGVAFAGGIAAFAQLQKFILPGNPVSLPRRGLLNASVVAMCLALAIALIRSHNPNLHLLLSLFALLLGALLVVPAAAADLTILIAIFNASAALAACAAGFALQNTIMIMAGALVGGSGIGLAHVMCRASGRTILEVAFGASAPQLGKPAANANVDPARAKTARANELAPLFEGARRVVIVPGHGMAVARAHHAVRELATLLESRGTQVEYAINPVAGHMPGHMNILLAEADVPYAQLREPDQVNPLMSKTDVVLVIGANDAVNPAAGMPHIDAAKARSVVVIKRGTGSGFAGVANPLFAAANCRMFFADGKQAVLALTNAIKQQ